MADIVEVHISSAMNEKNMRINSAKFRLFYEEKE